jgi:hypothetical protein
MNRFEVISVSSFLILITLFGISNPSNSFEWLMAAHDKLDILRMTIAMILLSFSLIAQQGHPFTNLVFRTTGLSMFGLLLGNVFMPDLYLAIDLHLFSLDSVAFIEGTIVCVLYSLNEPLEEPKSILGFPARRNKNSSRPQIANHA